MIVGSLLGGKVSDLVRAKAVAKSENNTVRPEFRIQQQIQGFVLSAGGILMYGWFVEFKFHPALTLLGSALGIFKNYDLFVTKS